MKIVIDARTVTSQRTGIGSYLVHLAASLSVIDQTNNYCVMRGGFRHWVKNKLFVSAAFRLAIFFYDNFIFPVRLFIRRTKIYHNPSFILPLLNFSYQKIITIHDLGFYVFGHDFATGWHARHLRFMLPRSVRKADKIIAVSEATKQQIIDIFHVPAENIVVIYEGVSENFKQIQDRKEIEDVLDRYDIKKPYILFVGTTDPRKNVERLIQAFLQVKQDFQGLSLVIAGSKSKLFSSGLQKLVQEKDVILTGYVAEEDIVCLYNGAAVFAFPSLYEGFGLPILEAMACGTPVLTSNKYSMPEVAGDAAVLVDPENIEELAAGLKALLENSSWRDELREKGLVRARQFTWEKTAQETLAVYHEVMNGEK